MKKIEQNINAWYSIVSRKLNYEYKDLGTKGAVLTEANITKGVNSTVNLILESDVGILIKKGEE